MTDLVPPSGVVHWLGAGMPTGSGRGLVCETAAPATVARPSGDRGAEGRTPRAGLTAGSLPRPQTHCPDIEPTRQMCVKPGLTKLQPFDHYAAYAGSICSAG